MRKAIRASGREGDILLRRVSGFFPYCGAYLRSPTNDQQQLDVVQGTRVAQVQHLEATPKASAQVPITLSTQQATQSPETSSLEPRPRDQTPCMPHLRHHLTPASTHQLSRRCDPCPSESPRLPRQPAPTKPACGHFPRGVVWRQVLAHRTDHARLLQSTHQPTRATVTP